MSCSLPPCPCHSSSHSLVLFLSPPSWALCANNIFSELSILHMVVYICLHKKEWNWVICRDVDGPRPFIQSEVCQKEKNKYILMHTYGIFPSGPDGRESAWNAEDLGSIPGLGRSPGKGKYYPLQYPGLENSMDILVHGSQRAGHNWATFTFASFLI